MLDFEHKFNPKIGKVAKNIINNAFLGMKEEKQSKSIGYYDLPNNSSELLEDIEKYKKSNKYLKDSTIKDIVVIGIGGSSLGTKAIYDFLIDKVKTKKKLHFLENVDPTEITRVLKKVNKKKALFIVISKSGSTIETLSLFKYIMSKYKMSFSSKDDIKRLIAITDLGSSLSNFANKYGIKQFNLPLNVGGRFSVLSAVGILPLYLIDYDVKSILQGAKEYIDSFFNEEENHLLEKAYYYTKSSKKHPMNVMFSYSSTFKYFNEWYVQLWAESLGKFDKFGKNVGLTPVHLIGSIDQHSFLQLIIQGPKDKTVTVLKVKEFKEKIKVPKIKLDFLDKVDYINGHKFNTLLNEECNATYETLVEQKVPTDCIILDKISEYNIGALIAYYELLTSAAGQILQINTYDQPGVEFGKIKLVEKFKK